jgi:uncharacterized protein (DUF1778 family)
LASGDQDEMERTSMPAGSPQRRERLEARVTLEQKELLQRAAALEGTSVTDFVIRIACQAAARSIRDHAVLGLTARESREFVAALLDAPAPNAALRSAAERYRQVMGNH